MRLFMKSALAGAAVAVDGGGIGGSSSSLAILRNMIMQFYICEKINLFRVEFSLSSSGGAAAAALPRIIL